MTGKEMPNYKIRGGGKYVLLDHHVATGTEATYTYTPSVALDLKSIYREIYIIITGKATATFTLKVKLNAATNYDNAFISLDTTTVAGAVQVDETAIDLIPNGILDGAMPFHSQISIFCNDAVDQLCLIARTVASHEGQYLQATDNQTSATAITAIEVLTSTSTWIAGTEITTYGIKR